MLLSKLFEKRAKGYDQKENVLSEEFEFVRNALFTDPDDQSGWFYYLWLLDQTLKREPLFISSWPPHGSSLSLSIDNPNCRPAFSNTYFQSKERTFPLILYFSEAVEGVSTSTVNIEFDYDGGNGLIWRPLSANKLGFSQAWLTYIKYPDDSLESCHVKVTIAQFPGIISSIGMPCSQSCHISFTASICSNDQEQSEVQVTHKISWNEENFKAQSAQSQDTNLLASLRKLHIGEENKPTAPMLCMETISNEIAQSRELLSSSNW